MNIVKVLLKTSLKNIYKKRLYLQGDGNKIVGARRRVEGRTLVCRQRGTKSLLSRLLIFGSWLYTLAV